MSQQESTVFIILLDLYNDRGESCTLRSCHMSLFHFQPMLHPIVLPLACSDRLFLFSQASCVLAADVLSRCSSVSCYFSVLQMFIRVLLRLYVSCICVISIWRVWAECPVIV